ncbi:MAG TPA: site-2 protease family protein [Candidatus Angelobacter sp.]|nr:site-2 protease family protein [Candidatus Angelobacter sp.]
MRTWSIHAGKTFGVELRVHVTFLLLLLFSVLVLPSDSGMAGIRAMERGMSLVAVIFASVVLHELGHVLVSHRNGVHIRGIMLLPIGGISLIDPAHEMETAKNLTREVRIALAGPLVNLLIAAATAMLATATGHGDLLAKPWVGLASLWRSAVWINVFLFALNLLPGLPMDGGRILRAWLSRRMDFPLATRRAVNLGHLFAAIFMFAGIAAPPWFIWFMLIGLFMFVAAQMEERTVLFQSVVEAVHMEDIMLTEFSILSPADTLEDALNKAVHSLQDDFPVVRGGDLVGVIDRQAIVERLRREGNGYVQSAMSKAFEVAARSESLASAFRKLTSRGLTLIPVVDQERLVGIVTLQNLMHSMGLLAESRRLRRQAEEQF